jgi:hypothetical protein
LPSASRTQTPFSKCTLLDFGTHYPVRQNLMNAAQSSGLEHRCGIGGLRRHLKVKGREVVWILKNGGHTMAVLLNRAPWWPTLVAIFATNLNYILAPDLFSLLN